MDGWMDGCRRVRWYSHDSRSVFKSLALGILSDQYPSYECPYVVRWMTSKVCVLAWGECFTENSIMLQVRYVDEYLK